MSDDYGVDLDEILRVIERAAVLIVRFEVLEQRLLVDFRADGSDGPIITLVDRVNSAEERFRHLKSLRPRMPLPERILSFPWPRAVAAFDEAGVWDRIAERLRGLGVEEDALERTHRGLHEGEAAVTLAAIRGGEGFRTIWERGS